MVIDGGIAFLLLIQSIRHAAPDFITGIFSAASNVYFSVNLLPILVFAFLFWCVSKKYGSFMGFNMVNMMIVMASLKGLLAVPRPWILNPDVNPVSSAIPDATGASCPSGHTFGAMYLWGSLLVILRKRLPFVIICAVMIALIAFSRLYLGVHTPLDVGLALVIGAAVIFINWKLIEWVEHHPEKDRVVLIAELLITLAFLLPCLFAPEYINETGGFIYVFPANPGGVSLYTGFSFGFFIGWFIERRLIRFEIPSSWKVRILSFIPGAAAVVLILMFLNKFLAGVIGSVPAGFISFFFLMFFITAVYPWILKKVL